MFRSSLLAAWLVLLSPAVLMAAPHTQVAPVVAPSLWMENYTSPELAAAIGSGKQIVLLPVGGIEQNGPHMDLAKHNGIIRYTAEAIATQLGSTLIAPIFPIAPQGAVGTGNRAFPGTLSISDAAFEATISDITESLRDNGFRLIVLIGEHGGSIAPLERVASQLSNAWAMDGVRVLYLSSYHDVQAEQQENYLRRSGMSDAAQGSHAGVADTSEYWAANPKGIRRDKLAIHSSADSPKTGATGDTRLASKAIGKTLLEIKIMASLAHIHGVWQEMQAKNPH